MKLIEYFFDTKQKREIIFVLIFMMTLLGLCFLEIVFFANTFRIVQLEDLYALIPLANYSFIGRLVANLYQIVNYDWQSIFYYIIKAINFPMLLCNVYCLYFIQTKMTTKYIKLAQKITLITVGLLSAQYFFGTIYVLSNIKYTTYETVLNAVKTLSLWIIGTQVIQLIVVIIAIIILLLHLKEALCYQAIEIAEDDNY